MAKTNDSKEHFYSVLKVDGRLRRALFLRSLISLVALTILINYGVQVVHRPWLLTSLFAVLIGLPLMTLPLSEAWVYQPWQADTQKVEQQFRG